MERPYLYIQQISFETSVKESGSDSISPELVVHAAAGLKSYVASFFTSCAQNPEGLEKSASSCNYKAFKTCRGSKQLSSDFFTLCSLQDPRTTCLCPHRPSALSRSGGFPSRKVLRGTSYLVHAKHTRLRLKRRLVLYSSM